MLENHNQNRKQKKKRKGSENGILAGSIVLCVVTLAAIAICMTMVFRYRSVQMENAVIMDELEALRTDETVTYTQEEADAMTALAVEEAVEETGEKVRQEFLDKLKELMLSGDGATAMLRYFYPDEIVLADAGQYYFFPILDSLKHNTYDPEKFAVEDDGFLSYYDNEEIVSHKGIDVSTYQGEIDWEKVADAGVEYAFLRLGIRGYTEGGLALDDSFVYNIEEAHRNHIDVGVYFFTQAVTVEEAREEAQFVLDALEPYQVDYPVVLDVEAVSSNKARTRDLTQEERTECCLAFCEMIRDAGYTPMIYGNLKTFMLMLDIEQLEEYDKWFAYYGEQFYFPYEFKIWQYTDKGSVAGVGTDVDLNISFGDWSDE